MPIDISSRPTRCSACSPAIPRRWPAPLEIVDRCRFSLDELAYQYPEERADPSLTPQQTLEKLTWEGAAWRYPEGLPDDVAQTLRHELRLIEKLRLRALFPDGPFASCASRARRTSSARAAAAPPIPRSATCWASPQSIRPATTCCSSASCRRSAASRPTSTSISSMSGARSSCSGSSSSMAATTPRYARPSSAIAPRARSATSARRSA